MKVRGALKQMLKCGGQPMVLRDLLDLLQKNYFDSLLRTDVRIANDIQMRSSDEIEKYSKAAIDQELGNQIAEKYKNCFVKTKENDYEFSMGLRLSVWDYKKLDAYNQKLMRAINLSNALNIQLIKAFKGSMKEVCLSPCEQCIKDGDCSIQQMKIVLEDVNGMNIREVIESHDFYEGGQIDKS